MFYGGSVCANSVTHNSVKPGFTSGFMPCLNPTMRRFNRRNDIREVPGLQVHLPAQIAQSELGERTNSELAGTIEMKLVFPRVSFVQQDPSEQCSFPLSSQFSALLTMERRKESRA